MALLSGDAQLYELNDRIIQRLYYIAYMKGCKLPSAFKSSGNLNAALTLNRNSINVDGTFSKESVPMATVRTNHAIPACCSVYYFEVTIHSNNRSGAVAIGLCSTRSCPSEWPGMESTSFGYHSNSGRIYHRCKQLHNTELSYGESDVIGCGVNFVTNSIFFTKNGVFMGPINVGKRLVHPIYPCVAFSFSSKCRLSANFGQHDFEFNIGQYMERERAVVIGMALDRKCNDKLAHVTLRNLVASYLLHNGYLESAQCLADWAEKAFPADQSDVKTKSDPDSPTSTTMQLSDPDSSSPSMTDQTDWARLFDWSEPTGTLLQRRYLVDTIRAGDYFAALKQLDTHFQSLSEREPSLGFVLRCHHFIQLLCQHSTYSNQKTTKHTLPSAPSSYPEVHHNGFQSFRTPHVTDCVTEKRPKTAHSCECPQDTPLLPMSNGHHDHSSDSFDSSNRVQCAPPHIPCSHLKLNPAISQIPTYRKFIVCNEDDGYQPDSPTVIMHHSPPEEFPSIKSGLVSTNGLCNMHSSPSSRPSSGHQMYSMFEYPSESDSGLNGACVGLADPADSQPNGSPVIHDIPKLPVRRPNKFSHIVPPNSPCSIGPSANAMFATPHSFEDMNSHENLNSAPITNGKTDPHDQSIVSNGNTSSWSPHYFPPEHTFIDERHLEHLLRSTPSTAAQLSDECLLALIDYGRNLRSCAMELEQTKTINRTHLDLLHGVFGLIAYENPYNSPFRKFLDPDHRERLAEAVNSAILVHVNQPAAPVLDSVLNFLESALMCPKNDSSCVFSTKEDPLIVSTAPTEDRSTDQASLSLSTPTVTAFRRNSDPYVHVRHRTSSTVSHISPHPRSSHRSRMVVNSTNTDRLVISSVNGSENTSASTNRQQSSALIRSTSIYIPPSSLVSLGTRTAAASQFFDRSLSTSDRPFNRPATLTARSQSARYSQQSQTPHLTPSTPVVDTVIGWSSTGTSTPTPTAIVNTHSSSNTTTAHQASSNNSTVANCTSQTPTGPELAGFFHPILFLN